MIKPFFFIFFFLSNLAWAEEKSYSSLEQKINLTFEKKAEIELELAKADETVHHLEALIREKRKILLTRTRALSYLKNFKWGSLFAIDDPIIFERNLRILTNLNQYDLSLFRDYKASIRNLAQGRQDLVLFKKELETVIADLQNQEKSLQEKEQTRKNTLAHENKKSLLLLKGKMPVPIASYQIKWGFGSHRDEQNEYAFLIRGLLFKTAINEKIHAVGPGKVISRDAIPYWGETLIIQHDDNYYSIYAGIHLEPKMSEDVKTNDVIALTKGNEFYFELRHFTNPINPKHWLKELYE